MQYVAYAIVIALVASVLLRKKPDSPKAATLEDFSFPTAEEGRAIPVLFGTRLITGANVVWYGDLRVSGGGGGKK